MRTKDLLTKLAALRLELEDGNKYITLEVLLHSSAGKENPFPHFIWLPFQGLQARKLPPNMDRFLYNVAGAENMTINTHK